MKYTNKLFYLLGIMLFIVLFQNCGMQFSTLPNALSLSSKQSGNGGGYEGKPDGTYYHFIPSYTCEGKPAAEQITEVRNGQAYVYSNQTNQCANQSAPVPTEDIHYSPFQNDFITLKDVLFKRYEVKPAGIPNNLAEVLCRDNFDNPTFEIVSHYDREKNEALTRVYFPYKQLSDFSVSRLLSSTEVKYVADGISFKVDLSKSAMPNRKFAGAIEKTTMAGLAAQPLVCVIGGSIDTSKWSMKPLTKLEAGGFQLLKNNDILFFSEISRRYFSPLVYQTVTHLFKITPDGEVSDLSKTAFGENYDVKYRNGVVSDTLYMYSAKLISEMYTSAFVYDSDSGKARRLTNLVPGALPEVYNYKRAVLTADRHLIYDTYRMDKSLNKSLLVKMYNFADDKVEDILEIGPHGAGDYLVLPKSNKLLLYFTQKNNQPNVLQVRDVKTKTSNEVQLQLPAGCRFNFGESENSPDERFVLGMQYCEDKRPDILLVSIKDGKSQVLATNSRISWFSEDRQRFIMSSQTGEHVAYDLRSGKKLTIPVDPWFDDYTPGSGSTNFIQSEVRTKIALSNDRYLFGFGGKQDAPTMYSVDLESGKSISYCENAIGKKLYIGQLPNQKVFLFTYDTTAKVYRFYHAKSPTDCARINEFPSPFPQVPVIMVTNIGFGLLLGNPLTVYSTNTAAEAVFVPIDGRPPLKFNSHAKGNWQMTVSEDKNRIVLHGPDASNIYRVFSFDL